jgi:damage-control phosphatase, subfamily I
MPDVWSTNCAGRQERQFQGLRSVEAQQCDPVTESGCGIATLGLEPVVCYGGSEHRPNRPGLEGDMKTHLDCIPCFLRQTIEAARQITTDARVHEQLVREVLRMGAELDLSQAPPLVGQRIRRRLGELTGVKDPYQAAKNRFNRLAMAALPEIALIVKRSPEPLLAAARFAIAANAIDMGVAAELTDADVREALLGSADANFHGDEQKFKEAVADAKQILYLADNAGEIAVDRLLIEQLGPERRVTLAVRGAPVLNDATIVDADEVGMHELVEVIDNGSDVAGTALHDCSPHFRQRFRDADLIIAKGQGNFETLSDVASNTFFLFKVKCPVLSRQVGLPLGTHALLRQGRAGV